MNYGTDMHWETPPYDMGLGQFVDRQGVERTIELTPLPFYDAEKRIPRGLEIAEF